MRAHARTHARTDSLVHSARAHTHSIATTPPHPLHPPLTSYMCVCGFWGAQLREALGAEAAARSVAAQAAEGLATGVLRAVQGAKPRP